MASYDVPNIIAVAASDQNDALAYFSNYGSVSVDVARPGENIYSAIPARKCVWLDNFDDGNMSGWTTSGVNNKWGLTTKSSASGKYSLADSPDGNYSNNTDSYAVAPKINLGGEKGAALKFNMEWNLEADEDAIFVGINEAGVDTTAWLGYLTGSSGGYYELGADISKWDGKNISVVFRMYSNKSSTYDGVYIDDVEITSYSSLYSGAEYDYMDGTSMAAPFVSGLAGLIWSVSHSPTNSQIKQAILNKVDVLPGLQKKVLTGGRINAYGAVSATAVQADTTDVFFGTNNNPVLVLNLLVDGCFGRLDLNSIQVDSRNTLDSDIAASGAKIWRSQSSVFDTATAIQIGSGKNSNDSIWHDINYDLLKETADSSLLYLGWDTLVSGSKQVYTSNSQTFPSDSSWVDFNFGTTTFDYNGAQNLLILVSWHRLGTLSGSTMTWCGASSKYHFHQSKRCQD